MARVTILASRPTIRVARVREDDRVAEAKNHSQTKTTLQAHKSKHLLYLREQQPKIRAQALTRCQCQRIGVSLARRIIQNHKHKPATPRTLQNKIVANKPKLALTLPPTTNSNRKSEAEKRNQKAIR